MKTTLAIIKMLELGVLTAFLISVGVMACSAPPPTPETSFQDVEQARAQARENAQLNAQGWRALNGANKFDIYSRGDSTIVSTCPNGDGWASIDLVDKETRGVVKRLKCSTVSAALSCLEEEDFKGKPQYAGDEGKCQPQTKVPFPLPKLTQ